MYLPSYGKFAQPDPAYDQTMDAPVTWNLYNYCTNNPVTHTDPDGRQTEEKVNNWPIRFAADFIWLSIVPWLCNSLLICAFQLVLKVSPKMASQ